MRTAFALFLLFQFAPAFCAEPSNHDKLMTALDKERKAEPDEQQLDAIIERFKGYMKDADDHDDMQAVRDCFKEIGKRIRDKLKQIIKDAEDRLERVGQKSDKA